MLPPIGEMRAALRRAVLDRFEQGHDVADLMERVEAAPASWDALAALADELERRPLREGWAFVEPSDWEGICAEADPARPSGPLPGTPGPAELARRVRAGFLASVCGCVLGKPLEVRLELGQIRAGLGPLGAWPIRGYLSEREIAAVLEGAGVGVGVRWPLEFAAERLDAVPADDDLNYSILGMLNLERHGVGFTHGQLAGLWLEHLAIGRCYGPERSVLVRLGLAGLGDTMRAAPTDGAGRHAGWLNPLGEYCGAMIRADAYGYAAAGRPALAAELAWRDASLTHRRTGIYGAVFAAAAIAAAASERDPLRVFSIALGFVPRGSRFAEAAGEALHEVSLASDWLEGHRRVSAVRGVAGHGHCRVLRETGYLMNAVRFAEGVEDGLCKAVMQGLDTDSYGCTAGSILGMLFGAEPGAAWLRPFRDELRTSLAGFTERSLSGVADRMARLPGGWGPSGG